MSEDNGFNYNWLTLGFVVLVVAVGLGWCGTERHCEWFDDGSDYRYLCEP